MLIRIIQTTVVDLGFVDDGGRVFSDALNSPIFVVAIITSFITLFAKYAAINRRFHDLNRSSIWTWCLFFLWKGTNRNSDAALVMFGIEIIALIVLCFIEGTKGENKYGPEPQ